MADDRLAPYLLIVAGIGLVLVSFPTIREATIGQLQSAEILPKLKLKNRDREIISGAGPSLSLMILGFALIGAGVLELLYS